jgi:FMN-dependent NADH-azoreductase
MSTLLHLDSSPLETSVTRELTREFAQTWKGSDPTRKVIYRDLAANPPKPVDAAWISAAFAHDGGRTTEHKATLALSDQMIAELEEADEYVIGAAMHNFTIPSVLKLWLDQVLRKGRTFEYDETGARGLLHGKKATVVTASGGIYRPGTPTAAMNFVDPYLTTVLKFMGVSDVHFFTAEGTSRLRTGAIDRASLLAPTLEAVRTAAV